MHMSSYSDSTVSCPIIVACQRWRVRDNSPKCKAEVKRMLGHPQSECRDEARGLRVVRAFRADKMGRLKLLSQLVSR